MVVTVGGRVGNNKT